MMLTTATARAAVPRARAYKLFDEGGLFLFVAPTGLKSWRWKHRRQGREALKVLGQFPAVSLAEARVLRDQLKRAASGGVDIEVNSFAAVARAWHAHQAPRWSEVHAAQVLAQLEADVLPEIGALPLAEIAAPELLNVLRSVEQRGRRASAKRLRQRLSAIFGYAIALGQAREDPAAHLGRAMEGAGLVRKHPALTDIADCRALLTTLDGGDAPPVVRLAARFLALTAVRLDAARGCRWDEFEDLDGPEPVWRVPPARMKLARAKKDQPEYAHLVPLSPQALAVLRAAAKLQPANADWPAAGLVFPGRGKIAKPIGERAIGALHGGTRFAGRHVPHGWRASFSTILNELEPDWRSDIDRALAHAGKGKVEAAYNRAQLLDRRRAVFDRWGELLAG